MNVEQTRPSPLFERDVARESAAFDRLLPVLRQDHGSAWVVIVGDESQGAFQTFEAAVNAAVAGFGDLPFVIAHTDDVPPQFPFLLVEG